MHTLQLWVCDKDCTFPYGSDKDYFIKEWKLKGQSVPEATMYAYSVAEMETATTEIPNICVE